MAPSGSRGHLFFPPRRAAEQQLTSQSSLRGDFLRETNSVRRAPEFGLEVFGTALCRISQHGDVEPIIAALLAVAGATHHAGDVSRRGATVQAIGRRRNLDALGFRVGCRDAATSGYIFPRRGGVLRGCASAICRQDSLRIEFS